MAMREDESLSPVGEGRGIRSRLTRLLVGLVVLGLAASTLYLLAERNSRSYYLSQEGPRLVVSRGAWLPSGKRPYLPQDPHTAKIYAPVELPPDVEPFRERRFQERQDLDRALFDFLAGLAEARIRSEEPAKMREGFAFVERASLLPGIGGEQASRLRLLRAELSFFEGKGHLEEAMVQIRQAKEKLELATEASSARGEEAALLLQRMAPAAEILGRALQRARGWNVQEPAPGQQAEEQRMEAEEESAAPAGSTPEPAQEEALP